MTLTLADRKARDEARRTLRELGRKERAEAKRARAQSPKADRGRVRDNGYLAWLRRQPCVIANGHCSGHIDAAHIRTPKPGEMPTGLQRKPDDRRATSLCRSHHSHQHSMNELAFWRMFGLDPFEVAERLYAEYLAEGK